MDKNQRKELINAYKNHAALGGVYRVTCNANGRKWLRATTDMERSKSRFDFAVKTQTSPEPAMLREFREYGIASFSFTVLEELKQKEDQTATEFADDVQMLLEIWQEKESGE